MDQSTHIEPARIDELLSAYRELQSQFERVLERLRRAEDNKHTVQRRIFDRVHDEYNRELDSIRARMSPLREELDRVRESLDTQCRDAASAMQSIEDELAEAEFRHRTGEYEPNAFADVRQGLDDRATEVRTRHALLNATLTSIEAMRRPDSRNDAPASPTPTVADLAPAAEPDAVTIDVSPASVDAQPLISELDGPAITLDDTPVVTSPPETEAFPGDEPGFELEEAPSLAAPVVEDTIPARPVLAAHATTVAAGRGDSFENPHDWISEMAPDTSRAERRPRVTMPAPAPAPAPASTPAAAAVDELDSVLKPVALPGVEYPSLVFVTGAHAGQSIALLPTTLTIGREHDNNVEIKDPDVARYHARILRDRDRYVVEDLNSSTGTWVNGERTQRAVLTHGDVIKVGQTELALDFEWTNGER